MLEIGFLSERWLSKQGYSAGEESESDPKDTMALLQAASLEGLEAMMSAGREEGAARADVSRSRGGAAAAVCGVRSI